MLERPRFKPHLRVEVVAGEGAFVLSGGSQTLLRGRLYELVVPYLGGGRSADEVCDQLEGQVSPAEVYYVITQLEKKGYLCEQEQSSRITRRPGGGRRPSIRGRRSVGWRRVRSMCGPTGSRPALSARCSRRWGFVWTTGRREARLGVVLVDGYQRTELAEYNADALRDGRAWLLARPVGRQIWIGPLFRPGVTACWECLAQRLRTNSPVATYLAGRSGRPAAAADDTCRRHRRRSRPRWG